ncbi:Crp/Fnr family transcriptional regulator [Euhalothece natronophila Z-M001]|uniref:Crp/Fnr family transcriptional regulator n=1 Tax=Euhalothece natronophila Z-M001 TaxID=522448 RepID=A0A5B8NMH0_9CHRO|nr:Crp/Fnr family transcriptional regulator [Euhalothece natronophila]QDZ39480.1 Crp/Fnr family transcriptional regulator [Euhalothece natronophila Z-M001]
MESGAVSDIFPLLSAAETETLDWLLSVAVEEEFAAEEIILSDQYWGNAVYFIISGWVKARRWYNDTPITLSIQGRGDFFGESAVLDEPPRATEMVTLSETKVMSISAQRFIQTLFQDPQLHHKLLQITVRRLKQTDIRLQLRHYPSTVKLAYTLVYLAENYGKPTEDGMEVLLFPEQDIADIADLDLEQTQKYMTKFQDKGWLEINKYEHTLSINNFRQLSHLAGGNF